MKWKFTPMPALCRYSIIKDKIAYMHIYSYSFGVSMHVFINIHKYKNQNKYYVLPKQSSVINVNFSERNVMLLDR